MKKELKRQGTQNIISFTSEDLKIMGWKIGDKLDISDAFPVGPQNFPSADHENLIKKVEE